MRQKHSRIRYTLPLLLVATTPMMVTAQELPGCASDPAHSAFAWRLGEWTYLDDDGNEAGTRLFEWDRDGCVMVETFEYQADTRFSGSGHIALESATGVWHQFYSNNNGYVFYSKMRLTDGEMAREGLEVTLEDGTEVLRRDVFAPASGNRVVQRTEESRDGGNSWTVLSERFDVRAGGGKPNSGY